MNKTLITIAIALMGAAATSAFAAEADGNQWLQASTATKSREQVNTELQQARRDGVVGFAGSTYQWLPRAKALASRDDVRAEFRQARELGELPARGEAYDGAIVHAQRPAVAKARKVAAAATEPQL